MTTDTTIALQHAMCARFGVLPVSAPGTFKVGLGRTVGSGLLPLNGLRHEPTEDTTGWYIWAGANLPDEPDFFLPLHVEHLGELVPEVIPYLTLPPGWRFLIAPGHEDVWEDVSLLDR